jgi:hypothetical protein
MRQTPKKIGPQSYSLLEGNEGLAARVAQHSQGGEPLGTQLYLPVGNIGYDQLSAVGLHDQISFIQVEDGYEVQLFPNVNGGNPNGQPAQFTGPAGSYVGGRINDETSFIRVRALDVGGGGGNGGGGNGGGDDQEMMFKSVTYVTNGLNADLEATFYGPSPTSVTWRSNGRELATGQKASVSFDSAGRYDVECIAESPRGVLKKAQINVTAVQGQSNEGEKNPNESSSMSMLWILLLAGLAYAWT